VFGYIRPDINELKVKEYTLYKSVYCGLCRRMKKCTGCLSCFALNYDFVFLALFRSALLSERVEVSEGRCQFNPLLKRHTASFQSLDYSAASTAVSVYHKLDDDRADGELGIKALVYPTAVLIKNRAHRSMDKAGGGEALNEFSEKAVSSVKALQEAEKSSPSPDEAAEISAELTSALFAAGLEGAKGRIAREVGRHIGKWIYFCDAADDFEKDKKRGSFNPFASEEILPKERINTALLLELDAAAKAVELIDFEDSGVEAVLKNILYLGMPKTAGRVLFGDNKRKKKNNYI